MLQLRWNYVPGWVPATIHPRVEGSIRDLLANATVWYFLAVPSWSFIGVIMTMNFVAVSRIWRYIHSHCWVQDWVDGARVFDPSSRWTPSDKDCGIQTDNARRCRQVCLNDACVHLFICSPNALRSWWCPQLMWLTTSGMDAWALVNLWSSWTMRQCASWDIRFLLLCRHLFEPIYL
jgi:hypothetical protein